MTRYLPARHYRWFGISAVALAGLCAWLGTELAHRLRAGRPVSADCRSAVCPGLPSGDRDSRRLRLQWAGASFPGWTSAAWTAPGWISPLIIRITLFDDSRLLLVYPGDLDSCNSLLRHLRRLSRDALIDGIPYRQYWGEVLRHRATERKQHSRPLPRYRILRPEDEAEVERLYQRLKTVGNLDQKNSTDEK